VDRWIKKGWHNGWDTRMWAFVECSLRTDMWPLCPGVTYHLIKSAMLVTGDGVTAAPSRSTLLTHHFSAHYHVSQRIGEFPVKRGK
jgi:hypothetical protein